MEDFCLPASDLGPVEFFAFWRLIRVRFLLTVKIYPQGVDWQADNFGKLLGAWEIQVQKAQYRAWDRGAIWGIAAQGWRKSWETAVAWVIRRCASAIRC